jgi:hypothetical protein
MISKRFNAKAVKNIRTTKNRKTDSKIPANMDTIRLIFRHDIRVNSSFRLV